MKSFPYQPFNVHYKKGMEIPLADALSRVTPTPVDEDGIQLPIVAVNLITSNLSVSSAEIELIHGETSKDPTLTLLRHYIHMGWPNDHRMLPQELHMFWNYREDLSDKRPCYSSREVHNFLSFYQVNHVTSSPHYPQSNGFAEALVGIAKKLMEKSVKDGKSWNYGLMQYRTTPISSTLPSPLEMLTGKRPHSTLPQLPLSIGKNMETSRI